MKTRIKIIEKFVKAKDGRVTYRSWLTKYLEVLGYLKRDVEKKIYISLKDPNKYFSTGRNYDADILEFVNAIKDWAPATKKSSVACLKMFFMYNNVEVEPRTKYDLKSLCRGPTRISQEKVPTRADLKKILSYGNVKHKALFLTMASSGMRPGEATGIKPSDIHLDETPGRIEIPYDVTRTKEGRTTYISSEAKAYIKQWLRIRDKYMETARRRSTLHPKLKDDDRIFPFSGTAIRDMWLGVTKKAGYDGLDERNGKNIERHLMTPQKLRKFFKTSLSNAGIPFEVVESLMGHKEGMSAVYRSYTDEQLKQQYLKGEEHLLIFERPANQEDIDSMKIQLETLTKQMDGILEFQSKVTPSRFIEDEDGRVVEVQEKIPPEAIKIAYEEEQRRKKEFEHLTKTLGSEELARKVMALKKKAD